MNGTSDAIEITIVKETSNPGDEEPSEGDGTTDEEPSEGDGTKDENKNTSKDNISGNKTPSATSPKELPKAGFATYIAPVVLILVIGGGIALIKYRKYRGIE